MTELSGIVGLSQHTKDLKDSGSIQRRYGIIDVLTAFFGKIFHPFFSINAISISLNIGSYTHTSFAYTHR